MYSDQETPKIKWYLAVGVITLIIVFGLAIPFLVAFYGIKDMFIKEKYE